MDPNTVQRAAQRSVGLQISYFIAIFVPGAVFALPWSLVLLGAAWLASLGLSWLQCYVAAWALCTGIFCADFRRESSPSPVQTLVLNGDRSGHGPH